MNFFDMERYLRDHFVAFRRRLSKRQETYILEGGCLFNPEHEAPFAEIIVMAGKRRTPDIRYRCYAGAVNDLCRAAAWEDVRKRISGDEDLTQYYREE